MLVVLQLDHCGLERAEPLEVVVHIAEQRVHNGEPLEVVADVELVRHAHAAVQLHRALTNETT